MDTVNDADEYRIEVAGLLDPSWSEWFGGLAIQAENEIPGQPVSLMTGRIADPTLLRGILNKIFDLNLKIVSISLVHPAGEE